METIAHGSQAESDPVAASIGGECQFCEWRSVISVQGQTFGYLPDWSRQVHGRVHQAHIGFPFDGPFDSFLSEKVQNDASGEASFFVRYSVM